MSLIKRLVQIAYAPMMLIGFIAAGIYCIAIGANYSYLPLLVVAAIGLSFLAERIVPYDRSWNTDHADGKRDTLHAVVNEVLNSLSVALLPLVVALLPDFGIWPGQWPLWVQLLFAILVADFGITMVHYISHKVELLWRFHAVHHSVKRMYGFNGLMKHPVHQAIELLGGTLPLILMGIPLDIAALLAFAVAIQLLLQHSNVDMKIGPLRHILALAPVHRYHHIKWPVEGDVNFGLFTTIWDHMLGTAVYEKNRVFTSDDLGIGKEPDYPDAYLAQIARPFKSTPAQTAVSEQTS